MAENNPAAPPDTPSEAPITINIKSSNDAKYTITVPLSQTVLELKTTLSSKDYADIPTDRQRLIYSGRVLKDADILAVYKIKEGNTVHLVKGAASNQRQNPTSQGSSGAGTTGPGTGTQPGVAGVPTNLATGTGNNPLAGLTGARYAGYAQLPGAGMFGPDGGMGPPPNPEDMINLLQNPQFASTLDEALSNPQYIDMMIQSNPMLRGMGPQVRAILQNPEYRRMIMDPQMMRQAHQMQQQYGGGMFGGMGGMGGGGEGAFPAPGATDQTPEGAARTGGQAGQQQEGQGQQPPTNPFGMFGGNPFAMMGNPGVAGGAGGQQAANPFAALFGPQAPATAPSPSPGGNNPPTTSNDTSTSPPDATRENPSQTPNPTQAPRDPNNPQNGPFALLQAMMGGMNPNANPSNPPDPNQQQQQQPPNSMAMLQNPMFQEAMQAYMRGGGGPGGAPNNNNNPLGDAGNLPSMMNNPFFGGMGGPGGMFGGAGGGGPPNEPADTRPPEERYAEQLRQLNDMGFFEFDRNVAALRRSGGNVQGAVEFLLG